MEWINALASLFGAILGAGGMMVAFAVKWGATLQKIERVLLDIAEIRENCVAHAAKIGDHESRLSVIEHGC